MFTIITCKVYKIFSYFKVFCIKMGTLPQITYKFVNFGHGKNSSVGNHRYKSTDPFAYVLEED